MSTSRTRMVGAAVVVDSRGSVLSVAIEDRPAARGERLTEGFLLERGQRVVKVRVPVDTGRIDPDALMARIRAKVPRSPTPKKRAKRKG